MLTRQKHLKLCALEHRIAPTAGLMDTTFNGTGILALGSIPNYYTSSGYGVAVQPDGKTVVAGKINSPANDQALVFRLNVDGSLDTSFANNGLFISQFSASRADFRALALQPDGKIVATGDVALGNNEKLLTARLNPDGTLDNTFDDDGLSVVNFSSNSEKGYGIAVQADGKIVVVGEAGSFMYARYTAAGALDTTFDLDGIVEFKPGGSGAWGRNIALQPDGKIVGVGGGVEIGSPNKRMMLIRLNADGSFDTSFDGDGVVTTSFPGAGETGGNDVAVRPNGTIMAVGFGTEGANGQLAIGAICPMVPWTTPLITTA